MTIEYKTYSEGSIYIEEGGYTKKDILGFLEYFEVMEKRSKELARDMRTAVLSIDEERK